MDSYHCAVCGATDDLWRRRDASCRALLCETHCDMLEDPVLNGLTLKEKLMAMGVKFGEQPMDEGYKDEDFLHDCGIKVQEPWEWHAAMHEKDVKESEDGKADVLKKWPRSNRKL